MTKFACSLHINAKWRMKRTFNKKAITAGYICSSKGQQAKKGAFCVKDRKALRLEAKGMG